MYSDGGVEVCLKATIERHKWSKNLLSPVAPCYDSRSELIDWPLPI